MSPARRGRVPLWWIMRPRWGTYISSLKTCFRVDDSIFQRMRIFIDSRHRTVESLNSSDFPVELSENIELPRGTRVRLHDVSLPYSWRTVEAGINDFLYLETRPTDQASTYTRLQIPVGQYDGRALAAQLGLLMNGAKPPQWAGALHRFV